MLMLVVSLQGLCDEGLLVWGEGGREGHSVLN